jgi:hypothetical protein
MMFIESKTALSNEYIFSYIYKRVFSDKYNTQSLQADFI